MNGDESSSNGGGSNIFPPNFGGTTNDNNILGRGSGARPAATRVHLRIPSNRFFRRYFALATATGASDDALADLSGIDRRLYVLLLVKGKWGDWHWKGMSPAFFYDSSEVGPEPRVRIEGGGGSWVLSEKEAGGKFAMGILLSAGRDDGREKE